MSAMNTGSRQPAASRRKGDETVALAMNLMEVVGDRSALLPGALAVVRWLAEQHIEGRVSAAESIEIPRRAALVREVLGQVAQAGMVEKAVDSENAGLSPDMPGVSVPRLKDLKVLQCGPNVLEVVLKLERVPGCDEVVYQVQDLGSSGHWSGCHASVPEYLQVIAEEVYRRLQEVLEEHGISLQAFVHWP